MGKTIKDILIETATKPNTQNINKILEENPVYKDCFKKTLASEITQKSLEIGDEKNA